MRSVFLVLAVLLAVSGKPLRGQAIASDPEIRKFYLSLDTARGDSLLNRRYSNLNPEYFRLVAMREFLQALFHQSASGQDRFFRTSSDWIDRVEDLKGNDAGRRIALAEIHIYRAVLAGLLGDYQSSGVELLASYRVVSRWGSDWAAPDLRRLSGILGVLLEQVPDPWRKWLPLLGVRASGMSGFSGLERYYSGAPEGSADRLEGYLLLITALREFDDDPGAARSFALSEGELYLDNPLVAYQSAMAALKAGECRTAENILTRLEEEPGAHIPYCRYQLGRCLVYLDRPEGRQMLESFALDHPEEGFRHSALLFAAWYAVIHGDSAGAEQNFMKIREFPEPLTVYDRQALRLASTGQLPDTGLLRARLLLDGGFYAKCIEESKRLVESGQYGNDGVAELTYRMARAAQHLGDDTLAESCFLRVLECHDGWQSYMVPNSALQLGLLYKKKGRKEPALKYFHICLDFNHYEFRDGINRQAQREIRELER